MSIERGTPVSADSGSVAATVATATLAKSATQQTYLSGFWVTGLGATAGSAVTLTVTGLTVGTMHFVVGVPAGATVPLPFFHVECPRDGDWVSALNTDVVVSCPSFGSGNTAACVTATGYYH